MNAVNIAIIEDVAKYNRTLAISVRYLIDEAEDSDRRLHEIEKLEKMVMNKNKLLTEKDRQLDVLRNRIEQINKWNNNGGEDLGATNDKS